MEGMWAEIKDFAGIILDDPYLCAAASVCCGLAGLAIALHHLI